VILGDFNLDRRIVGRANHFDRVNRFMNETIDMGSTYHSHSAENFGLESRATHYHLRKPERRFHCDFIYAPKSMLERVEKVSVPDFSCFDTSDHRPVICEFSAQ
jgi:endonuclease/exonuclease/phosphatase family metal-dependent hydrolase